jgi:mRNA interferase HicA
VKRRDLIATIAALGCEYLRRGGRHDIYRSATGRTFAVPRHKEINELTARAILRDAKP